MTTLPFLVSADWLARELGAPDLLVLDATLFLPTHDRDARAEFEAEHVPGAVFMDLKRFQPLPELERLRAMLSELGAGEGVRAVVYDNSPLRSAARGWWLLRHAGLEAAVLDGGLAAWRDADPPRHLPGRGTAKGGGGALPPRPRTPPPPSFAGRSPSPARAGEDLVRKDDLLPSALPIIDARSSARFRGEEAEPRADVAPGHMPGARNLPYSALFNADGTYRAPDELRAAFVEAGVDVTQPMIATCGSGVTACNLILAATLLGNDRVRLYDGSWTEWGADPATPKVVGPA